MRALAGGPACLAALLGLGACHGDVGPGAPTADGGTEVDGPLDAEQKARLMEIADKCPVHRTLTSEIRIETRMAEA